MCRRVGSSRPWCAFSAFGSFFTLFFFCFACQCFVGLDLFTWALTCSYVLCVFSMCRFFLLNFFLLNFFSVIFFLRFCILASLCACFVFARFWPLCECVLCVPLVCLWHNTAVRLDAFVCPPVACSARAAPLCRFGGG